MPHIGLKILFWYLKPSNNSPEICWILLPLEAKNAIDSKGSIAKAATMMNKMLAC